MRPLFRLLVALSTLFALMLPAVAADRAIIILDASGSMWAQINGKARIDIARETLKTVLAGVPSDLELGFMAYGHRSKGDCNDIEMLVQPAPGTADAISAAAAQLSPKGKTPLSASVKMAAEQLKYTEDKATVILITDGLETCDADPCALATELKKAGVDFKVDVVGLALSKKEGDQVRCIADNTGGQYLSANDADALKTALTTVVTQVAPPAPTPPPAPPSSSEEKPAYNFAPTAVLDEAGDVPPDDAGIAWQFFKKNADGSKGENTRTEYGTKVTLQIDPGDYIVTGTLGFAHIDIPVTITADAVAQPEFDFEAGFLDLQPIHSEGQPVNSDATVKIAMPNGDQSTGYGELKSFVPAGTSKLTVSIGAATVEDTVDVAAGQHVDKQVIVGAAHLAISAVYADGGDAVANGSIIFSVQSQKKDIAGNRKEFVNGYGPTVAYDVPAGDYTLVTTLDGVHVEQDFSVKPGDAPTIVVNLNAGILAMTLADSDSVEVQSTKKNIEGKRTSFGGNYGPTIERTLPAGDYHLIMTYVSDSNKTAEADVTVKAGERLDYDASEKKSLRLKSVLRASTVSPLPRPPGPTVWNSAPACWKAG